MLKIGRCLLPPVKISGNAPAGGFNKKNIIINKLKTDV